MRSSTQLGLAAALLLQSLPLLADDVITNVMSPIVSYQYPNDFSSEALSNGGILSPRISYQYAEWPGNDILELQRSPSVSFYFQSSITPGPVTLHGRVTDTNGLPLSGATVSAMIYLAPVAQANTDANGNYQMPSLDAGVYNMSASDSTHQASIRALTLNANTAKQDFQLKSVPPMPTAQQVNRSATVDYTVGDLMGSALRIYDGSMFVRVTENNWPDANLKTIVMTHGWQKEVPNPSINKPFDLWPTNIATKLLSKSVTPENANILVWDWRYAASASSLWKVGIPNDRTLEQGAALGERLQYVLGANYQEPLHFLGHSLGTLLNASAINYLRGKRKGREEYSPTPWKNNRVHVTLFDHAEVAGRLGTPLSIYSALPLDFTWADNYKSIVGLGNFPGAVNVNLQKGLPESLDVRVWKIPDDSHGYAIHWYGLSIMSPLNEFNPLGFKRSYEYAPTDFSHSDLQNNNRYHQTPFNNDELALEPVTRITPPLPIDAVVQIGVEGIQYTGGAAVKVGNNIQDGASDAFNYMGDVASQGRQGIVNIARSPLSLGFLLGGVVSPSPLAQNQFPRSLKNTMRDNEDSTIPMVWLNIRLPVKPSGMVFDFMIEGDAAQDVFVCRIGTNDLFTLAAKYIPTNQFSASRWIDVSEWAGTTNELFFGFMGGSSTDAVVHVQNIRFYSLHPPELLIANSEGALSLIWPTTAPGYAVVTKTNLESSEWETLVHVPKIVGDNYVLTNSTVGETRFFRLEQQ